MASRALVARLVIAASSCAGSATTGQRSRAGSTVISMSSPSVRAKSLVILATKSLTSIRCGCNGWRRAKVRSRRVRSAPTEPRLQRVVRELLDFPALTEIAQQIQIADDDSEQIVEIV